MDRRVLRLTARFAAEQVRHRVADFADPQRRRRMIATAAQLDEVPAFPPLPSNTGTFGVAASISARCAPAELPETAIFSASTPSAAAFARNQRNAAFTSWICAGQTFSPDRRYSGHTHT
jgi:hypothetical protein